MATCSSSPSFVVAWLWSRPWALAALAAGGIGAAQRRTLVDGDIMADFRRLADHGEAMVDEEAPADPRAGMNVVARQEPRVFNFL